MVRHWLRTRAQGWRYRIAHQRLRRGHHRGRGRRGHRRQGARRRSSSLVIIPILVGVMLFIRREYDTVGERAGPAARAGLRARRSEAQPGDRPGAGPIARGRPGRPVRAVVVGRRPRGAHHRRRRGGREAAQATGSGSFPACRSSSSSRPSARSSTPFLHYLDVMAADRGAEHHDRRPARVRAAPLVGPAALQPDGQPAEAGPGRATRHGRRRRPVRDGAQRRRRRSRAERLTSRDRAAGRRSRAEYRCYLSRVPDGHCQPPCLSALSWASTVVPRTRSSSASAASWPRAPAPSSIALHVVEVDWRHDLDEEMAGAASRPRRCSTWPSGRRARQGQAPADELLQARDVGAALVDEAVALERRRDHPRPALPQALRRRLRDRRTIPYVFQNAPCEVIVVREPVAASDGPRRGAQIDEELSRCASSSSAAAASAPAWPARSHARPRGHRRRHQHRRVRPPATRTSRARRSAATAPTRTSCAAPARTAPTASSR